jgi:hypothetical protein
MRATLPSLLVLQQGESRARVATRRGLPIAKEQAAMSREDRTAGHRKQARERDRQQDGGRAAAAGGERDAGKRGHLSAKTLKTYDIREDEAQRQIRELQSRY